MPRQKNSFISIYNGRIHHGAFSKLLSSCFLFNRLFFKKNLKDIQQRTIRDFTSKCHHHLITFGMRSYLYRFTCCSFLCLIFCLLVYVKCVELLLIWRPHHYWRSAAKMGVCSTLVGTEQWRFLCVPNLLWHGISVYMNMWYLKTIPVAELLAVCFYCII